MSCPAFESGYMEPATMPFTEEPGLVSEHEHPELVPYRSLCASRLRIVGEGAWPMEQFLDGVLWLPFQEPAFLLHGFPLSQHGLPNFKVEDKDECKKLALTWDAKNLLSLYAEPLRPGLFSRVFNAYKNLDCDRQIGDRRAPNRAEYHIDGPSQFLPQGHQLTKFHVPQFTHCIHGSMTDRRDFYHQAQVTSSRAQSNMLPCAFPLSLFSETKAYQEFLARAALLKQKKREKVGDGFRTANASRSRGVLVKASDSCTEVVFPAFKSLFQGDHLGVEFALRSHETLLQGGGLLRDTTRMRGHMPFPVGKELEALVIDDYFSLSIDPVCCAPETTFAWKALQTAREVYSSEKLVGSPEKDVVAKHDLKAAGAEIRSNLRNVKIGYVPVAAPLAKRMALSVLSLRAACLPATNAKVASRLCGNWISVLQYRKCFSSIIDDLFRLANTCLSGNECELHPLSRKVACELTMLAAVAPLVFTNVAAGYLGKTYATDASNQKGAIVEAEVSPPLQKVLWLDADRKGGYTHLNNSFNAVLRQIGEADDDRETACPFPPEEGIHTSPLMYFDFVEICGGAGKVGDALARRGYSVAPVLDLSESPHYDLTSLRFMEWLIYMLEEGRFRSFLIAPPCTSFSPAAHPAVRSYAEPLGFDRTLPKTLLGNTLAFRALCLLRVGRRHKRPCAGEQSRLSKMCWLSLWVSLRDMDFSEAIIASCAFQSIHKKEFRFICHLLDTVFLDTRCAGGHSHVKVEGAYTKPSAIYTDALAEHLAEAYSRSLDALNAEERLSPNVDGLETLLSNEVMQSAHWSVSRAWSWKRQGHINVLELGSSVSCISSVAQDTTSSRFVNFVDSAVCQCALAKGRSASHALQPGLKRTCALCVAADLYPAWTFSPTRLNSADDPTRDVPLRAPVSDGLSSRHSLDFLRACSQVRLRRFAANWLRLVLFLISPVKSVAWTSDLCSSPIKSLASESLLCVLLVALLTLGWTFCAFGNLSSCGLAFQPLSSGFSWNFPCRAVCSNPRPPFKTKINGPRASGRSVFIAMVLLCSANLGEAMPLMPQTAAEIKRKDARADIALAATRTLRKQTADRRDVYLQQFKRWLWEERGVSYKYLIEQKPADPERIASLLVDFGKELYHAGRAYGIYAETINAVACSRPLIKRQLTQAWDLAFAWLCDEPGDHNPAMPLAILAAMVAVSLTWGWPHFSAVLLMSWAGVMRIGEVLAASREELVLPGDCAPGTSFALVMIKMPKTRGRAARHQAARIDQEDIIRFLSAMYAEAPKSTMIWPYSAATLRKRFSEVLKALQLPTEKEGSQKPFSLGSMRPGGATWLLHATENSEVVRRRGRWISTKVMEIYLQEVLVATYIEKLKPKTKVLIELCSGGYEAILNRCIDFLQTGIPVKTWFYLLRDSAEFPTQKFEDEGADGDVSAEPLAAWPGEVEGGSRDAKVRQAANVHPKVLPKSRTRSASPPVQQRTSATAPSGATAARQTRSSSPVQVSGQGGMSLGRVRQAPSRETSPKSAARPAAKATAGGRTPSPPARSQLTRQPAKVRLDGKRRPEVKGVGSQVMSQLNALWQKVEELEDKVERERSQKEELRSEKEELRRENQQLQHRLEVLMVDPAHGGASSVPVEEPSWSVTRSPPMQERRVSDVTPIVVPSPPKSLNAFRQLIYGSSTLRQVFQRSVEEMFCATCCAAPDKTELDIGKPLVEAKGVLDRDQVKLAESELQVEVVKQFRYPPFWDTEIGFNVGQGRSHGLNIDTANDEQAVDVSGAALTWNRNASSSQQIKAADLILKVNGEPVTGENVHNKLADAAPEVTVTLQHAVERNLTLQKPGQLGITVKFAKLGHQTVLRLAVDSSKPLQWQDRIIAVNGVRGQSQDLVAKMREVSDTIALVVTAIRQDAPTRELVALHTRSAPLRQSLVSSGSLRTMNTLGGYHSLQAQTPLRAVPVPFNGPPIAPTDAGRGADHGGAKIQETHQVRADFLHMVSHWPTALRACVGHHRASLGIVVAQGAFTIASCTSTRPCRIGQMLTFVEAECAEGGGARSEELLHGDICTLVCPVDATPTLASNLGLQARLRDMKYLVAMETPQIVDDGSLLNMRMLWCHVEFPEGKPKQSVTRSLRSELFTSEQLENLQNEIQVASAEASGAFQMPEGQYSTTNYCGDNPGPACVRVQGLCDISQDGDFYKHPVCISGQAQWIDGSMRIRYDGDERNGQAGKWLLETDVLDLLSSGYGSEVGRQPTFNPMPTLGSTIWNLKCRYPSNNGLGTYYIQYRTKILELVSCTCDSLIDCNGRGEAVGSKENGPNCVCECSPDRAGDSCEIPLCQVPGVMNSRQPACLEGNWIMPNGVCTPSCQEGYQANHPSFTCTEDGAYLLPLGFTCDPIWVNEAPVDEFGNTPDAYEETTTTTPPEA
eukprot:s60_g55.t1